MLDENKYIENIEYLRAERVEARVQFERPIVSLKRWLN
jgi:hypothetical protein